MLSKRQLTLILTAIVLITSAPLHAKQPNNLVLIIPQALPASGPDRATAPALTRLRHEGVDFTNSHSGFPRLSAEDEFAPASNLKVESLVAASSATHSVAFIDDTRTPPGEQGENLQTLLDTTLPNFKASGRPFLLVYRLVEPARADEGAPAYLPSPRAADAALDLLESRLKTLGLFDTTNIVVAAEHVLSRVLKISHTSSARKVLPREETLGTLPPGFLSIDILAALKSVDSSLELFDPDNGNAYVHLDGGESPKQGNAIVAADFDSSRAYLRVEAHGAHDSIYFDDSLSRSERRAAARLILESVFEQDYTGGVFVNEKRVGRLRGALPLEEIARGEDDDLPDIVVAFATVTDGCNNPAVCTSVIADTLLPEGEGIINSFNRAGTKTFLAARGPDFRTRFASSAPASNEDLSRTIAALLGVDESLEEVLQGRVLAESLASHANETLPKPQTIVLQSKSSADGAVTHVQLQTLNGTTYFDTMRSASQQRLVMDDEPWWRWRLPKLKSFTISISDDED